MSEDMMLKSVAAIKRSKRICIFTGAGMSKDSGIDTFRGNGQGFWSGIFGSIALVYGGTPFGIIYYLNFMPSETSYCHCRMELDAWLRMVLFYIKFL
jgi:NAD-dependent SIR2 family protein deacetylase